MTAAAAAGLLVAYCLTACGGALGPSDRTSATAVGPGTILDGRSEAGELQRFRIESVAPDPRDRDGDVSLYGVSVLDASGGTWRPYCTPDVEGRSAAIPVQGSWNDRGERQPGDDLITFACTSGAIAKCIRFGYKPWQLRDGTSLAPYHAACIRMVRADYCGDGRTHTVDGTWIDVWDGLGIQVRDERAGHPEVFEAAWSPAGAAYLHTPRWSDDVADVVRDCPEHFRGRTSADRTLAPADVAQQFPEVLVFDARYVRGADRRIPLP